MSDDQPLNGQQIQAMQRQFQDALRKVISDTDLRKLALDYACKVAPGNPLDQAQKMYDFLSAPASEVRIVTS